MSDPNAMEPSENVAALPKADIVGYLGCESNRIREAMKRSIENPHHLPVASRAEVIPRAVWASGQGGEGDVPDNLGGPEEGESLIDDEASDFAT